MNDSPLPLLSRSLIVIGLLTAGTGVLLHFLSKVPKIGRLPGDIFIQKGNFSFYFPLATSLLLSLVLTLILNFFNKRS